MQLDEEVCPLFWVVEPGGQEAQVVAPLLEEYVPVGHLVTPLPPL